MSFSLGSPTGPWSKPRVVLRNYDKPDQNQSGWDCYVTNPSVVLLPDSSEVMLVFSSVPCTYFKESLGVAFAPHWNDTYVQSANAIWRPPVPKHAKTPTKGIGNIEDPFAWTDKRGNFHIVAHSQGNKNVCDDGETGHTAGVHLFATAKDGPWTPSNTAVYCSDARLTNGTMARFTTRQRPQIIFSDDGLMSPRYMVNGGSFDGWNQDVHAHERTFMFEFES